MSGLLRRLDLGLQFGGALVDDLELRQVGVQDAHDLRDLDGFVSGTNRKEVFVSRSN